MSKFAFLTGQKIPSETYEEKYERKMGHKVQDGPRLKRFRVQEAMGDQISAGTEFTIAGLYDVNPDQTASGVLQEQRRLDDENRRQALAYRVAGMSDDEQSRYYNDSVNDDSQNIRNQMTAQQYARDQAQRFAQYQNDLVRPPWGEF